MNFLRQNLPPDTIGSGVDVVVDGDVFCVNFFVDVDLKGSVERCIFVVKLLVVEFVLREVNGLAVVMFDSKVN